MSRRPEIPDRLSSLILNSFQEELIVLEKRKASAGSSISGLSGIWEFLDTKIKLLGIGIDLEVADVYREGLRQVSGNISAKETAAEEEMITVGADSSPKELLVIKRQPRAVVEDMADDVSRQNLEDAYTQGIVGKVMAASGNQKRSKFNKSKFRKDVEEYYSAHSHEEIVRIKANESRTSSAQELSYLFGIGEKEFKDLQNGTLAVSPSEDEKPQKKQS